MSCTTYRRSSSPSESSDSGSSSSFSSSSHSRGIYVPLHKRSSPSSTTSLSETSSSRPSSPSKRSHKHGSPTFTPQPPSNGPRIYTTGYLLSLRPFATEGLKDHMRTTCPEVVMNRRMRKSIEFNENQARSASKALLAQQRLLQQQHELLFQQQQQQQQQQQYYQQQLARVHAQQRHAHAPTVSPPAHFSTVDTVHVRRARPTERRREVPAHRNALGGGNGFLVTA